MISNITIDIVATYKEKVEKSKLFNDPGKATNLMTILFFIPGTPKDLLLYIGPLLPIKWWVFVLISTFVRLPSVVTSTVAGAGITNNNFAMMAWMYGGVAVSIVLVELILHFRKSKHTKDIKEAKCSPLSLRISLAEFQTRLTHEPPVSSSDNPKNEPIELQKPPLLSSFTSLNGLASSQAASHSLELKL